MDVETEQKFMDAHEDLRNSLVWMRRSSTWTPCMGRTKLSQRDVWLRRGQRCALPATLGREGLNLHGAIDLESGETRIMDVESVDAQSTIALFEALERAHSTMSRIHVFLDDAVTTTPKQCRAELQQLGRRIVCTSCVILSASQLIERLWKVMHENVTYNRC